MKNIRHIGIVVRNMKRSLYFYKNLLGFKIEKDGREEGSYIDTVLGLRKARVRTVKLRDRSGALVELLYYDKPAVKKLGTRRINDIGYSHFAVTVDDIDREYRRLKGKGIKFTSTPEVSPDGYAKIAFCEDPDGAFIELVEVINKPKGKKRI